MSAPRIRVHVAADGSVTVSVEGVAGSSCSDVTRAVETALGATVDDRRTPDFYLDEQAGEELAEGV